MNLDPCEVQAIKNKIIVLFDSIEKKLIEKDGLDQKELLEFFWDLHPLRLMISLVEDNQLYSKLMILREKVLEALKNQTDLQRDELIAILKDVRYD